MKKLSLRLDGLQVESFATTRSLDAPRGTVRGNAETEDTCAWPTTTLPTARVEECDTVFPTTTLPTAREDECG